MAARQEKLKQDDWLTKAMEEAQRTRAASEEKRIKDGVGPMVYPSATLLPVVTALRGESTMERVLVSSNAPGPVWSRDNFQEYERRGDSEEIPDADHVVYDDRIRPTAGAPIVGAKVLEGREEAVKLWKIYLQTPRGKAMTRNTSMRGTVTMSEVPRNGDRVKVVMDFISYCSIRTVEPLSNKKIAKVISDLKMVFKLQSADENCFDHEMVKLSVKTLKAVTDEEQRVLALKSLDNELLPVGLQDLYAVRPVQGLGIETEAELAQTQAFTATALMALWSSRPGEWSTTEPGDRVHTARTDDITTELSLPGQPSKLTKRVHVYASSEEDTITTLIQAGWRIDRFERLRTSSKTTRRGATSNVTAGCFLIDRANGGLSGEILDDISLYILGGNLLQNEFFFAARFAKNEEEMRRLVTRKAMRAQLIVAAKKKYGDAVDVDRIQLRSVRVQEASSAIVENRFGIGWKAGSTAMVRHYVRAEPTTGAAPVISGNKRRALDEAAAEDRMGTRSQPFTGSAAADVDTLKRVKAISQNRTLMGEKTQVAGAMKSKVPSLGGGRKKRK